MIDDNDELNALLDIDELDETEFDEFPIPPEWIDILKDWT